MGRPRKNREAEEKLIQEVTAIAAPKRRGRPPKNVVEDPAEELKKQLEAKENKVELSRMEFRTMVVVYEGISPLICNSPIGKFTKVGPGPSGHGPKGKKYDQDEEFLKSLYPKVKNEKGEMRYSVPARWFRKAVIYTLSTMNWGKQVTLKQLKGSIFVMGDQLPLIYNPKSDPQKYIAPVRRPPNSPKAGTVEICRALFEDWGVVVPIRYNAAILTPAQIVNLFQAAGTISGFGEDRPERAGTHGMAQVKGAPSGLIPE